MNTAKLNDWMQVIGIFAVVGSLIFVGLQMRQEHEIARVMIYQSRASTTAETLASAASNLEWVEATIKSAYSDPNQEIQMEGWASPVNPAELLSGALQSSSFLTLTDNSHFQYQEGFLPEDHWQSVRSTVRRNVSQFPILRHHLESSLDEFRPAFRDEMIKLIAEIDESEARE